MTIAERLRQEGHRHGLQEGLQKAFSKGLNKDYTKVSKQAPEKRRCALRE